jgi:hypothetical protein
MNWWWSLRLLNFGILLLIKPTEVRTEAFDRHPRDRQHPQQDVIAGEETQDDRASQEAAEIIHGDKIA